MNPAFRMAPALVIAGICATIPPATAQDSAPRLTLSEAVAAALRTHPSLARSRAERIGAGERYREARSGRWPAFLVQGGATRFQEPMIVTPLHSFDPVRPPSFHRTLLQSQWTARYTLFDGGARGGRIAAARADVDAAEARQSGSAMAVIERVASRYLDALTAASVLDAATRRLAALAAERNRAALMVDAGRAPRVTLLRVDAARAAAVADSITAARDALLARRDLAREMGLDPDRASSLTLVSPRNVEPETTPPETAALARARESNPDLEAARRTLAAEEASLGAARATWLPALDLSAAYTTFSGGSGDFQAEWQGSLVLRYPIFSGGARRARIAGARARVEAASAAVRLAEMDVASAVDRARAASVETRARADALEQAVRHLEEVVRIERLALDAGSGTETDFLDAEADLFEARSNLARARHAHVLAGITLARTEGILTTEWLAAYLESRP